MLTIGEQLEEWLKELPESQEIPSNPETDIILTEDELLAMKYHQEEPILFQEILK